MRAGTERERQGNHAGDSGESGHENGAQTAFTGFDHGVESGCSTGAKALIGIEQQNSILGNDADDHDESHKR